MRERWSYQPLGARAGLLVSGFLKIGTWRSVDTAWLVCMKRGQPTLRVVVDKELSGGGFDELLISARDVDQTHAAFASQPR